MDRTTILLPHSLKIKAIKTAKASGLSLGDLIRTSLKIYCDKKSLSNNDVFFSDINFYSGDIPKNIAENHDDFLY